MNTHSHQFERNVLVVQRIGRLRLFQTDDERRAALDHRHFGSAGDAQILRHVVAGGAGAQHQGALALPVQAAAVMAGMPDGAAKFRKARQVRHDRRGADAVGEHDVARPHAVLCSVRAPQHHVPAIGGCVPGAAGQFGVRPDVEFHRLGVDLEPVGQHVLGNEHRPGARERHVGQVVDARLVVQRQGVVAAAPTVADARLAIHHQRIDAEQGQARGDGQPGLGGADHQHRGVMIRVGLRPLAPVQPVLAAEIALPVHVLPSPPVGRVLVPVDFVQRGHQAPGARGAAFEDQAHDAVAGTHRRFKFENGLDRLDAGTDDAAWRGAARGQCEAVRRHGRQRRHHALGDGVGAGCRAQVPGEREQITPMAIFGEQCRDPRGIAGRERRTEIVEPCFG